MTSADPTFEGIYGPYSITAADRQEVRSYRIALLITGLSLAAGVLQWWQTDSPWAWLWVLPMATALGLALRWIHIYLRSLHRALQLFWLSGCIGWGALLLQAGPTEVLSTLRDQPLWILAIGPLFAALAGIGFTVPSNSSCIFNASTVKPLFDFEVGCKLKNLERAFSRNFLVSGFEELDCPFRHFRRFSFGLMPSFRAFTIFY